MNIENLLSDQNFNKSLQIAALAEFSKSCGLINNTQFDKIGSTIANSFNDGSNYSTEVGIFKNNFLVDSELYKKSGKQVFLNGVSNLIYKSYFELLQTDQEFLISQADNLFSFKSGLLDMQTLRMIILDRISPDTEEIIRRIENGEKLSEAEIIEILKRALKSKKNEIAEDGKKTSRKAPDGTSNYTPFSALALQQRYKGIRWRPIKGTTLSPKTLEKVKKRTDSIKKQLEKVKNGLRTARSLVSLLRRLESTFVLGYIKIIQNILKIIFSFIRDIGSSGVYFLDMTSPYRLSFDSVFYDQNDIKKLIKSGNVDELERKRLLFKLEKQNIASTYDYHNYDIVSAAPGLSDMINDEYLDDTATTRKAFEEGIDDFNNKLQGVYKSTTYQSFIKIIADAFMDEGDIQTGKSRQIESQILKKIATTFKKIDIGNGIELETQGFFRENKGAKYDDEGKEISSDFSNYFRSGRPTFGPGSNVTVTIVAFSLPDFISELRNIGNILKILSMFSRFEFVNFFGDKSTKVGKAFKRVAKKMRINNPFNMKNLYNNSYEKPIFKDGKPYLPFDISEQPDFYGLGVRNLFGGFFTLFDVLEGSIDKFLKNFKSSLSKELDDLLDFIEEMIDDLDDFINLIDSLITFFDTLKSAGLYTLSFTSNGGNEDIVQKLLVAEGFPGVAEGDQLRLIGGFVFCYGSFNPKFSIGDVSQIFKQQSAILNYEAAMLKYEADGKSTNDPGSLEDYLDDNNFDQNYQSSLDKIFKKLF